MAKENINKFMNAIATNEKLAERLAALAVRQGYDFTAADLLELGAVRPLSDTESGDVAGGKSQGPQVHYPGI